MSSPLHAEQLARQLVLRLPQRAPDALPDLANWFPVTLFNQSIGWRQVAERFTAPFFTDTLNQQPPEARHACITPLPLSNHVTTQLAAFAAIPPCAFIFHLSRCGSTLLCQMLASLPESIVLSEPPIIDACLRQTPPDIRGEAQLVLLRQMVRALGQRRQPQEQHLFIKLDCWHIPYLPLLRQAFPSTPFWFLYREPAAVLASHQRQRGPQMVPDLVFPAQLTLDGQPLAALAPGDLDGYCLQVLQLLLQQALQHSAQLTLIHYRDLPGILWQTLLPQLGIRVSEAQLQAMQARSGFHAKRQQHVFHGDPPPESAPRALPQALQTLYAELEQRRMAQAEPVYTPKML